LVHLRQRKNVTVGISDLQMLRSPCDLSILYTSLTSMIASFIPSYTFFFLSILVLLRVITYPHSSFLFLFEVFPSFGQAFTFIPSGFSHSLLSSVLI
jgi:hypothetical protein